MNYCPVSFLYILYSFLPMLCLSLSFKVDTLNVLITGCVVITLLFSVFHEKNKQHSCGMSAWVDLDLALCLW